MDTVDEKYIISAIKMIRNQQQGPDKRSIGAWQSKAWPKHISCNADY